MTEEKNLKLIIENMENQIKSDLIDRENLRAENEKLKSDLAKTDEAYQIARDRVIELLGDIEQYLKHIEELKKENEKLKKYYDYDKEELMESCYSLAKENDKLKTDIDLKDEEIGMLKFKNDELKSELHGVQDECEYWKRETKKLKEKISGAELYYGNVR